MAQAGDHQARPQHEEHGDAQVAQKVLGQSEEAEQRAPDQGDDGERDDHPGDDAHGSPATSSQRATGSEDRYDR